MPLPVRLNGTKARAATLLAAGAVTGGVLAGALSANAASNATPRSTSSPTASAPGYAVPPTAGAPRGHGGPGAFGPRPARPDETVPSSSIVATLTKKAEARVPGGTVMRVETDAGDGAYEAHMRKADGTPVTVKFDKNLAITAVEDGMGKGDPMPGGAGAPPPSGSA